MVLPIHYHTGTAEVWTFSGRRKYAEYPDQPQTAGSYLYEPGGSVHTFYCPEDNTEDTVALLWMSGRKSPSTTTARSTASTTLPPSST